MLIDLLLGIAVVLALWRGYQRGLIIGIFSFLAVFIGIAAALRFSAFVAGRIRSTGRVSEEWLPLLSFLLVFLGVIVLVHLGARALERTADAVFMGGFNKVGGMLFYTAITILVFSILLFYAEQMQWLRPETLRSSLTYPYVRPWGPDSVNALGKLIPLFRDMFGALQEFFATIPGSS
ncbi:MAG: hypothetical protein RJA57_333 [Bacteroidota bacterium]